MSFENTIELLKSEIDKIRKDLNQIPNIYTASTNIKLKELLFEYKLAIDILEETR